MARELINNLVQIEDLLKEDKKDKSNSRIDQNVNGFRTIFLDTVLEFGSVMSSIDAPGLYSVVYDESGIFREVYNKLNSTYNLLVGLVKTNEKRYVGHSEFKIFYEKSGDLINAMVFLKNPDKDLSKDKMKALLEKKKKDFEKDYISFLSVFKSYVEVKDFKLISDSRIVIIFEGFRNQYKFFKHKDPFESKEKEIEIQNDAENIAFKSLYDSFIEELLDGASSSILDFDYDDLIELKNYAKNEGDKFYSRKTSIIYLQREFNNKFSKDPKRMEVVSLVNNVSQLFLNLFESEKNKRPEDIYANYRDYTEGLQFFCDKLYISKKYKRILSGLNGKVKFYATYLGRKYGLK